MCFCMCTCTVCGYVCACGCLHMLCMCGCAWVCKGSIFRSFQGLWEALLVLKEVFILPSLTNWSVYNGRTILPPVESLPDCKLNSTIKLLNFLTKVMQAKWKLCSKKELVRHQRAKVLIAVPNTHTHSKLGVGVSEAVQSSQQALVMQYTDPLRL